MARGEQGCPLRTSTLGGTAAEKQLTRDSDGGGQGAVSSRAGTATLLPPGVSDIAAADVNGAVSFSIFIHYTYRELAGDFQMNDDS